jgi:L-asparaginase
MLENLSKPVIFTGSQIPLSRMRSDGLDNLINSILIAASEKVFEVCLYFGSKLLRGNCSTKISSDLLEAFESPNAPHLAEAGINIQYNHSMILPRCEGPLRLQEFKEIPKGVLKIFPGIQFELFESIYDGEA